MPPAAPMPPPVSAPGAAFAPAPLSVPLPDISGALILDHILKLSRDIARNGEHVGHFAFVLFAFCYQCRPCVWEGSNRIDLIAVYAPWVQDFCSAPCMVDAITCCLVPGDAGTAIMKPVSDEHPLHMCSHRLTGVHIPREVGGGDSICSFYGRCGVAVLGTVMDGNCAFDAMSQMLATLSVQTPQSQQSPQPPQS